MKKSIFLFALMGLVGAAHATGTNTGVTCNGNSSCSDTYNTTNNTTNQGGTGIGQGGSASSVATGGNSSSSATGGTAYGGTSSAYNGGNTSVNANTVKNESTNVQGQQQGQSQAIKNSGNSASSSNNTGNNGNSTVNVGGDHFESARNPVNTAYAPSIAPSANCSLGISGGVSFVGFSGSFGKAYTDKDCVANEDIRNVATVLGDKETAAEMKCISSETYRKARAALNKPCAVEQE